MGKIENKTYKNIFITHEDTTTLQVFMQSKYLCGDIFRIEADKPSIKDIAIFCSELDQKDFNTLINKIMSITKKPTYISFAGDKDYRENEDRFREIYKKFPDNIFISHTVLEKKPEDKNDMDINSNPNIVKKISL